MAFHNRPVIPSLGQQVDWMLSNIISSHQPLIILRVVMVLHCCTITVSYVVYKTFTFVSSWNNGESLPKKTITTIPGPLFLSRPHHEVMQSFVLAPAPGMSEVVLEPYNSALCFQDLLEYTDQVRFVLLVEFYGRSPGAEEQMKRCFLRWSRNRNMLF